MRTLDHILQTSSCTTRQLQCRGCENHCLVTRYTFASGNHYYSGNKCERVFSNQGGQQDHGENIYPIKYRLLFGDEPDEASRHDRRGGQATDGDATSAPAAGLTIGIPRALGTYEDFPFWRTLLEACGLRVALSRKSNFLSYEGALGSVMSDNICFPAKLVHSHIVDLEARGVDRILMPYVVYERQEDPRTLNSYNCPIVAGYSDVVKSAMRPRVPLDAPVVNFKDERALRRQAGNYLRTLGVSRGRVREALRLALEAQADYAAAIQREAQAILDRARAAGRLVILLAGRPYHTDPLVQHKLSEMIAGLGASVISDDIVRGDALAPIGEIYPVQQWAYINRIVKAGQWAAEQAADVHFVGMTSFGCGPDAFIQDEVRSILQRHGKPFTLLKIDDISNIGSLKLRVRSLVESLRERGTAQTPASAAPLTPVKAFSAADRERTILVPFFTTYISPLMPAAFALMGYKLEVLPQSDDESVELGLKYANNEICYPATLIVGDIIKALRSGRYDLSRTAVAMSQTGGQCRATSYAGIIKRAMAANGFAHVPLLTLGVSVHAVEQDSAAGEVSQQDAPALPWRKYAHILVATLLFSDALSKMYHAAVVREREPGAALALRDRYLKEADTLVRANKPRDLIKLTGAAAADFDAITLDRQLPCVGVVGEIFLKFHPFAHQFLLRHIMQNGVEVVPPLLTPFFLQEFVNVEVRQHMGLGATRMPRFLLRMLYAHYVRRPMAQVNKLGRRFRYFRPFADIYHDARGADDVLSMAAQFGEGWLLPSDVVAYVRDGVRNVVSLQPFGCIANHIISKGIERKLHDLLPELNMLSLDFDSGVSAVNVTNRLLLFLDDLKADCAPSPVKK